MVFAMGIFLSTVVRQSLEGSYSIVLRAMSLALVVAYKPHYAPALIILLFAPTIIRNVRQAGFVLLVLSLFSIAILLSYQEVLGDLALSVVPHFRGMGNSTRAAFFLEQADFLSKAPEGMFLSVFGPTMQEARGGILHFAAFVESSILVLVILIFLGARMWSTPIASLMVVLLALFWLLIGTYPLGVMNPGTAIRYRTGYELLIFVLLVVLTSRLAYVRLRSPTERVRLT
ncbi:MAG: hypothetical protein RID42_07385 [Alphaproteobacteria bacterium]